MCISELTLHLFMLFKSKYRRASVLKIGYQDSSFSNGCWGQMSLYPRPMKLVGGILDSPCPSVCLSFQPSVGDMIFSNFTFKMAAWIFWFADSNFSLALNIKSILQWQITCVYGKEPINFQQCHFQNGCLAAILDFFLYLDSIGGMVSRV